MIFIVCRDIDEYKRYIRYLPNPPKNLFSDDAVKPIYNVIHTRGITINRLEDKVIFLDGWMQNKEVHEILSNISLSMR